MAAKDLGWSVAPAVEREGWPQSKQEKDKEASKHNQLFYKSEEFGDGVKLHELVSMWIKLCFDNFQRDAYIWFNLSSVS